MASVCDLHSIQTLDMYTFDPRVMFDLFRSSRQLNTILCSFDSVEFCILIVRPELEHKKSQVVNALLYGQICLALTLVHYVRENIAPS